MREFEVDCIACAAQTTGHEQITHIGHSRHDWCLSREAAIKRIEAGFEAFYVFDAASGERAYIGVVREPGRSPHLRTRLKATWTDHLLSLARNVDRVGLIQ